MPLIRFLGWVDSQLPRSRSRVRASSAVSDYRVTSYDCTVASRAGAWIETTVPPGASRAASTVAVHAAQKCAIYCLEIDPPPEGEHWLVVWCC